MSIFVLNLATLLGLGLGVDYSLLLTSRFREELAARPDDRQAERVADAVEATVATAGRAVFFSGLTVLLGLAGLVLFEFMILRSVGIAGAIVVLLAASSALTLLPALLAIVGPRIDALAIRRVVPARRPERTVGAPRPAGDAAARSRSSSRPWRCCSSSARRSSTSASTRRTRRSCRRASRRGPPSIGSPTRSARASSRRSCSRSGRTARRRTPANVAALYDYSRRLAADPRIRRVDSLVDVDPRLREEQYQLLYADPNGPRDRFVATALAATTQGRPDRVHDHDAVRPEPRRGAGARRRPPQPRPGRSRRPPG